MNYNTSELPRKNNQIESMNVLQFVDCWLPQTMVWMHEQLLNLSPQFISYVFCSEIENVDQFKISNLIQIDKNPLLFRIQKKAAYILNITPFQFHAEKIAKEIGIKVIHSHFGNRGWMNLRIANRLKVPHVVSFYGFDVGLLPKNNPVWNKRYQQLFSDIDLVIALGPNMAAELEEMGCNGKKIKIHHLGVDLTYLPFQPRQWETGQPLRILMAGSFKEKKGFPYALEAIDKLRGYADLEITIVGDATNEKRDQKEKIRIIDTVERLKLNSIVKFLGYQPYGVLLKEAYNHHIFLAPSLTAQDGDTEGIPMTTVEMAATGMPIISTLHADIPEIIQHSKTGWLVEEGSVDDLVSCLHLLISHPEQWEPALKAGREHIEKEFNACAQGNKLGEIYKQVI